MESDKSYAKVIKRLELRNIKQKCQERPGETSAPTMLED